MIREEAPGDRVSCHPAIPNGHKALSYYDEDDAPNCRIAPWGAPGIPNITNASSRRRQFSCHRAIPERAQALSCDDGGAPNCGRIALWAFRENIWASSLRWIKGRRETGSRAIRAIPTQAQGPIL